MKKITLIITTILAVLFLTSCNKTTNESNQPEDPKLPDNSAESNTPDTETESSSDKDVNLSLAEQTLKSMTLKEKVGQLFLIRPDSLDTNLNQEQINDTYKYGVTQLNSQMVSTLSSYPVGGIVFFGKNILDPDQITKFIDDLKTNSKIPLFIGIDEEGGVVSRIANSLKFDVKKYENMESIGNTKDSSKAKDVGLTIGTYLKQYGFNLNFAPVSDVNTNPNNIIIGNRAFGNDPELVAKMVAAEIEGLHEANIMSCIKHFPGHGDTKDDTHDAFVTIDKTWEELEQVELIPFKAGIEAKTDMVMISHITTKNITSDQLPSSLSNEMIEEKLRDELNYDGVIITDSMAMGAITQQYSAEEAAIMAISAGIDIILMPEAFTNAFDSVYDAVKNGTISEERINQSVLRILSLKEQYGLLK